MDWEQRGDGKCGHKFLQKSLYIPAIPQLISSHYLIWFRQRLQRKWMQISAKASQMMKSPGPDRMVSRQYFFLEKLGNLENWYLQCSQKFIWAPYRICLKGLNETSIVLIPQKKDAKELRDHIPSVYAMWFIKSLQNVWWSNRLRPILQAVADARWKKKDGVDMPGS